MKKNENVQIYLDVEEEMVEWYFLDELGIEAEVYED
jgi:hypothetical protein